MNIVMHCGGIPFDGNTVKTQSLGGSESAALYMARELVRLGHKVVLFTNKPGDSVIDGVRYVGAGPVDPGNPLGAHFYYYACNNPHDVLIIQRHPQAFSRPYASKVNVLWLHDLALYRQKDEFLQQMWNVDAVLTVSEYHKRQVCDVYGLNPAIVHPVLNGVDPELFSDNVGTELLTVSSGNFGAIKDNGNILISKDKKYLLYSSRPERGLEHLVRPGGIMERLQGTNCHLLVCGYDNTTEQMRDYYNYLHARCRDLPNVTHLGALTKLQLAQVMRHCWLHVYPTEFEEVSCITAMEAATAGLPFISSEVAALPETCKAAGAVLLPMKDGAADEDKFVEWISGCFDGGEKQHSSLVDKQIKKAKGYTWQRAATVFDDVLTSVFYRPRSRASVAKHMLLSSDVVALDKYLDDSPSDALELATYDELIECYRFYYDNTFAKHYADYYQYESDRGVEYGPENMDGNLRFESLAPMVGALPAGSVVVDYGCAHGHYTVSLARRYPDLEFIGVDIAQSNIDKATAWAEAEGLSNTRFIQGEIGTQLREQVLDGTVYPAAVLCCEVLEHVGDVDTFLDGLLQLGQGGTQFIFTTPFGPWEGQGYREHWPWRAHLYEFERDDIDYMFGAMPGYDIRCVPGGATAWGAPLGSYLFHFKLDETSAPRPYAKVAHTVPRRQTLSLCMIAKDAEHTIERCLLSVLHIVDEVIIGIDVNTTDATVERATRIIEKFHNVAYEFRRVQSPLEIGFDEARNSVIEGAAGDWILWLDADEELNGAVNLLPYLRDNMFNGYALEQHHLSSLPPGIIKVDKPCKVFRNRAGIKFYGVVHEHPEQELGKGVPYVMGIGGNVNIMHYGYTDEATRRGRFRRNLDLLVRDRKKYAGRSIGKFLWLRDLSQMTQWEFEATQQLSEPMMARSREGVDLWFEMLHEDLRMAVEALPFYSTCVRTLGKGFEMSVSLDTHLIQGSANARQVLPVEARFYNEEHAREFQNLVLHERVKHYESPYF